MNLAFITSSVETGAPPTGGQQDQGSQGKNILNTLLSLMGAGRQHVSNEPSDESIKRTLNYLHDKAKSATAVTVNEAEAVRPMMEVIWAPLLGALSVLFDEYQDHKMVRLCLQGFAASICLTAQVGSVSGGAMQVQDHPVSAPAYYAVYDVACGIYIPPPRPQCLLGFANTLHDLPSDP